MPKSFKDALGREWHPKVTCLTLQRYEESTGICLLKVFGQAAPEGETEADRRRRMNEALFGSKIGAQTKLVFAACAREAAERKVSQEDFAEGLDSQEILVAAAEALTEALADFFQSRPPA